MNPESDRLPGEPPPAANPHTYVALDFETTGLDPRRDRIVEVGAIRFDHGGNVLGVFQSLVNPGFPCPPEAARIHGIGDEELAGAEGEDLVIPRLVEFLQASGPTTLVAHNAPFDVGFLAAALGRCRHAVTAIPGFLLAVGELPAADTLQLNVFDTKALAKRHWPSLQSYRLAALADRFGLDGADAHRALADADRCRLLFLTMCHGGNFRPLRRAAGPADGAVAAAGG